MSEPSIWKRLVDAFQDQEDERKRKALAELERQGPCLPGRVVGYTVMVDPMLPPATMHVSQDVFDALKNACSTMGRKL